MPIQWKSPAESSVLVSDTLEYMRNKHLNAALHQVIMPIGINDRVNGDAPERYLIAFLLKADQETTVGLSQK